MKPVPLLVDREALRRNRSRARRLGPETVLHAAVADEIEERLAEVNREFTAPVVVTPFPEIWERRLKGALVIADDETLALEAGSHDLVIHALCLHWSNDPLGQIIQSARALRPDGLFLGACFGGRTLWELRAALAEAEARLSGGLSPRVMPMGEIRDLGALLQRAELALPVADSVSFPATYRSLGEIARDLRAMGEGNALSARSRDFGRSRQLFDEASRIYRESFPAADGRISLTFEAIFLTGWAPAANQPQPLRPGSATRRLADALGTGEIPLPRDGAPG